jgi:hypothetical protein
MAARPGVIAGWEVELTVISEREQQALGLQVVLPLEGSAEHFMIPGIVYGENRSKNCRVRYPRVSVDARPGDSLTADRWAFRLDRASHGAVFGWTQASCLALATEESSALGPSGLGFSAGESEIWLNFPAREEPVTFVGYDAPAPAEVITHDWQAGETATVRFFLFQLPPGPHAYDAVIRFLYRRDSGLHPLKPWLSTDEAAELAAHGLHRWHYRRESGTLAETVAFHRETDETAPVTGDREAMHVAWLSGAPAAHALLSYGRRQEIAAYADAGVRVLDTIASGLAPCGLFWGRWTPDGWDGGWNGNPGWIHARTVSEATLFMIRAGAVEKEFEMDHPGWIQAIAANLECALAGQRPDGAFPALVDGFTGAAQSWQGAAGLLWIPALLEAAAGNVYAAELAGDYYSRFVEDEFIFGAPEDIDLAPSSEDGYNALMAYLALYEASGNDRWLRLARRAAEWMLSFRWSYNLSFPRHTLLESYDYRSRGADLASPRNQHLHSYGLICLPELVRLAEHTGDDYFRERAVDNLAASLQFIARQDGDFNARKGMVSERYYNSRCFGPKGASLPVSHAWSAGLVLYACQAGLSLDA